jgi:hypothetical protein
MACLSVRVDGVYVICANPIFLVSDLGSTLAFEVFEDDSASLKLRLEKPDEYFVDSTGTFFGVLKSLEKRTSTHVGLALLRDKTTLYVVMEVHRVISQAVH